jgi:hypothetical protein
MLCSQMSLKSMKLINMFMWKNTNKSYVIVCLYTDNMLILVNNDFMIKSTKILLANKFDMRNLGVADVILGIRITRTSNQLVLSQSYYVENILYKFLQTWQ